MSVLISARCLFQDVDSAYLVKADLEDKVGALTDEINFLRNVYEEVLKLVMKINQNIFVIFLYFFICTLWYPVISFVTVTLSFGSLFFLRLTTHWRVNFKRYLPQECILF